VRDELVVRSRIYPLSRARRGVEDRLLIATPGLIRRLFAMALRGGPESRLRRGVLRRTLQVGIAANNRRDYEVLSAFLSRDVEMHMFPDDPEARPAGIDPVYRGHERYLTLLELWKASFRDHRWELQELLDPGGARFGARLEIVGHGLGSGVEVRQTQYGVWQVEHGSVERQWALATEPATLALLEDTRV
jgi:hypothetical protein